MVAQEEARLLNHNYIGTEHILLGLIREADGVAATALDRCGATLDGARVEVEGIIGRGGAKPSGAIPFTPRAKKVLELSLREALLLGDDHIGTEHILLGLIREGEGVALQVLDHLGVDLSEIRRRVMEASERHGEETSGLPQRHSSQGRTTWTAEPIFRCPGCGFAIDLLATPQELQIRMERSGDSPRFRIYLTSGSVPEHLLHECEPETSTP